MNSKETLSKFLKPKKKQYIGLGIFGVLSAIAIGYTLYTFLFVEAGNEDVISTIRPIILVFGTLISLYLFSAFMTSLVGIIKINRNTNKTLSWLEEQGETDAAAQELETKVKRIFGDNGEVLLTDNYIISAMAGKVFRLSDIIWVYTTTKRVRKRRYVWTYQTDFFASTYDETGVCFLRAEMTDRDPQIRQMYEAVTAANPNIVTGYSADSQREVLRRIAEKVSGK